MDAAASAPTDDFDGDKLDVARRREEGEQGFGFHLEMRRGERQCRPRSEVDEPETALGVGQVHGRISGNLAALIQRFTCRRSHGMAWAFCRRLLMMSRAPVCSAHRRKEGRSSGWC